MRCRACNVNLNDKESTRKYLHIDDYIELCDHCYSTIADDVLSTENEDLDNASDY